MLTPELLGEKLLDLSRELMRELGVIGNREVAAQDLAAALSLEVYRWIQTNSERAPIARD